jgi:hypothetical protein
MLHGERLAVAQSNRKWLKRASLMEFVQRFGGH